MPTEIQTVAGAAEFTGAAGAGFEDFAPASTYPEGYRAVIKSVSFFTTVAVTTLQIILRRVSGTPATARQILVSESSITDKLFSCGQDGIVVPRDGAGSFEIQCITTGKTADGSFIVDGRVTIRDLNRDYDWRLPDDEAATIAGLVLHESRRIPEVGQVFEFHKFRFEILHRQRNQITSLRIVPPGPA